MTVFDKWSVVDKHALILDEWLAVRRLQKDKRWAVMGDYLTDFNPYVIRPRKESLVDFPNHVMDCYMVDANDPLSIDPFFSHDFLRNARMKVK